MTNCNSVFGYVEFKRTSFVLEASKYCVTPLKILGQGSTPLHLIGCGFL